MMHWTLCREQVTLVFYVTRSLPSIDRAALAATTQSPPQTFPLKRMYQNLPAGRCFGALPMPDALSPCSLQQPGSDTEPQLLLHMNCHCSSPLLHQTCCCNRLAMHHI